jgi:hypothetical protein
MHFAMLAIYKVKIFDTPDNNRRWYAQYAFVAGKCINYDVWHTQVNTKVNSLGILHTTAAAVHCHPNLTCSQQQFDTQAERHNMCGKS